MANKFTVRVGTTMLAGEHETLAEAAQAAMQSGFAKSDSDDEVIVYGPGGRAFEGTMAELLAEVGLEA